VKIGIVSHGYPPELVGGTENSVQALARGLARLGHDVFVVAGSMDFDGTFRRTLGRDEDPDSGKSFPVHRLHRGDLFFDHWQKSACPQIGQFFEDILREEQPDVINVQHWIRLTRDLVARAARQGVPSVATLNDLWTTCLIAFRIRPDTQRFCTSTLSPFPCAGCAAVLQPDAIWMGQTRLIDVVEDFAADTRRELELASVVTAPCAGHVKAAATFLGLQASAIEARVVTPARKLHSLSVQDVELPKDSFSAKSPLVLCHFGIWSPLKGTDLLLEAIAKTRDPKRFRLDLAGGPSKPEFEDTLRNLARAKLPRGSVTFHGRYEHKDLADHAVAGAHLFVTATRAHESFGLVLDEAIELGLGCLVPNLGACGERADQVDWATAFASGDSSSLAALLDELGDSPERVAILRAAAAKAVTEEDFTARAQGQAVMAETMLSHLEQAVKLGIPKSKRKALMALDWEAREVRLETFNRSWDSDASDGSEAHDEKEAASPSGASQVTPRDS
jgi:glycosyltransferase involved in cell wall biosynthesis